MEKQQIELVDVLTVALSVPRYETLPENIVKKQKDDLFPRLMEKFMDYIQKQSDETRYRYGIYNLKQEETKHEDGSLEVIARANIGIVY